MPPANSDPISQITWLANQGRELLARGDWKNNRRKNAGVLEADLLPWQKSMLDAQLALRARSAKRFPDPERWLWTERSLAQASDWWTARIKSALFPTAADVVDACCGAGADTVALAQHCQVVALDRDELLMPIVATNLATHGLEGTLVRSDFADGNFTRQQWLHVDPDRRAADKRSSASEKNFQHTKTVHGEQFSPPLQEVLTVSSQVAGAVIKLAPTTEMSEECETQVDQAATRVWIGNMGECRQQWAVLGAARERCTELFGCGSGIRIAVLGEPWGTEAFDWGQHVTSFATAGSAPDRVCRTETVRPGDYVFDLHSVLHAAELQTAWASAQGLRALSDFGGYYLGAEAIHSPWVQAFEVLDIVAWDDRKVRKTLRNLGAGIVEVKNRLIRLDANAYQRRYSSPNGQPMSLLVTRIGDRIRAIVARRAAARGATGAQTS